MTPSLRERVEASRTEQVATPQGRQALADLVVEIDRETTGFEQVALLEGLLEKFPVLPIYSRAWRAHYRLGEETLRANGLLKSLPGRKLLLDVKPDDALGQLAAGRYLTYRGDFEAALAAFERAAALRPRDPIAATWMATTLATLGRRDAADELFQRIAARWAWPCATVRLSEAYWQTLRDRVDHLARAANLEEVVGHGGWLTPEPETGDLDGASMVVLASCDAGYFSRYAEPFVRSWTNGRTGGTAEAGAALLHLHVVNPDDACRARLDQWRRAALPVVATHETVDLPPDEQESLVRVRSRRTYYACARLRVLPWAIAHYRTPVLVTDIDLELCGDPVRIWRAMGEAETGLTRFSPREQLLWQEFYLALAAFRPTGPALRFAAMICAYLEDFLQRGAMIWSLDQAAIYSAHTEARHAMPGWRCAALPLSLIDAENRPSADTVFRHHVASRKSRAPS